MNKVKNYKLAIFLLLPLILGWLINYSIIYILPIYTVLIWTLNVGFVIFWFWVGKQFGQLRFSKVMSFLIGNSIWGISFGLFLWQFVFVDDLNRNMTLAGLSQHYGLFTVLFSSKVVMLLSNVINSSDVMITSYVVMLVIFTVGFLYGAFRASKGNSNRTI